MMRVFDEQNEVNEASQPNGKEQPEMSDVELSVEYQYGENKFRASGNVQDVNMHAAAFLSSLGYTQSQPLQKALTGTGETVNPRIFTESDTPSLADDGASQSTGKNSEVQAVETTDLPTFYRKKSPKTKADGVKVITRYYQKYRQKPSVTYKDFDEAYRELARIGVDEPGNIRTAVNHAISSKHLYRVDKKEGHFALTDTGAEYVDAMKKGE